MEDVGPRFLGVVGTAVVLSGDVGDIHVGGVLEDEQGGGVRLNHHLKLLDDLFRSLNARGHDHEEEAVGLRVVAGLEPHDVAVVGVGVTKATDVAELDGEQRVSTGGHHHGDVATGRQLDDGLIVHGDGRQVWHGHVIHRLCVNKQTNKQIKMNKIISCPSFYFEQEYGTKRE